MAKNIRSIDPKFIFWGQLRLALFLGCSIVTNAAAQLETAVVFDQFASHGFLKPEHWLTHSLGQESQTHWLTQKTSASIGYQKENWKFGIERGQQAYMRANTAALLLAAQDKINQEIDFGPSGSHTLKAEVWQMNATTFAFAYVWRAVNDLSIEVEPFLQTIHSFEHMRGDLLLVNSESNHRLTGTINKTGTRSYGFLVNDQPDSGWGSGLNLRMQWVNQGSRLSLSIQNAWSRQQFSAVHEMSRQYNATATEKKINIGDLPSVSGQYSVTGGRMQMPTFWRLSYEPKELAGLAFGVMGLGRDAAWTTSYSGHFAGGKWWVLTSQTRNWTSGFERDWGLGWRAAVAMSTDARGKSPLMSSLRLSKSW